MVSVHWPITVTPQPDELLSSWLHRLAYANGVPARSFARVLGLAPGMWSARLDLQNSNSVTDQLRRCADISPERLNLMTLPGNFSNKLFLPLRSLARRQGSAWLQFCPLCLADSAHSYFRREWRLATRLTCETHATRLRDRCPSCNQPVIAFDQRQLLPQHHCVRCRYDFRRASTIYLCPAVRRLDQCIHEIVRSGLIGGSSKGELLVRRLLNIPRLTGIHQQELLTGLSASYRARCYERLVEHPIEGKIVNPGPRIIGGAVRFAVKEHGGLNVLIGMLADALRPKLGRPTMSSARPTYDLSHFLGACQLIDHTSIRPQSRVKGATAIVRCPC